MYEHRYCIYIYIHTYLFTITSFYIHIDLCIIKIHTASRGAVSSKADESSCDLAEILTTSPPGPAGPRCVNVD